MPGFGAEHFYNQSIRKYTAVFGNMFTDLKVVRLNSAGTVQQTVAVPLHYIPREAWLVRLTMDPNIDRKVQVQLPGASFELTKISYDPTRIRPALSKEVSQSGTDKNRAYLQYAPKAWDLNYSLYFYVKNADDGAQLVEQVLPFFAPEWTHTVNLVPSIGTALDIPCILNSVSVEDTYEDDFKTHRAIIWTLEFTMKAYFYGPVKHKGVIKIAKTNLYTALSSSNPARDARVIVQPGQYANGQPTTNSAASISKNLIAANTTWGFCVDHYFFTEGMRYNPKTDQDV